MDSDKKLNAEDEIKGGRATPQPSIQPIDRNSSHPVYYQLADLIHQQILDGQIKPGEKIPPEVLLAKTYHVSPMTVRRAINLLAAQDIVKTAKGKGTYVKEVRLGNAAFYLKDIIPYDPQNITIKVIGNDFVLADKKLSHKLDIKKGQKVIYIQQLISLESRPAFYHRAYLIRDPFRPIVEAELDVVSHTGIFQGSRNQLIRSGDLNLESCILDSKEMNLLQIHEPIAGYRLEHTFYDFNGQPLSWGWFVCSNKQVKMQAQVGFVKTNMRQRDERARYK